MPDVTPVKGMRFRFCRGDRLEEWEITSVRAGLVHFALAQVADMSRAQGSQVRARWAIPVESWQRELSTVLRSPSA